MFDDKAVHVSHVEGPVGAGLGHGGPKPIVRTGKEFGFFLTFGPSAGKGDAIWLKDFPMDQVMNRLADEYAGPEFGSEKFVPIGRCAIRAGYVSVLIGAVWPFHLMTDREAPT